MPTKDEIIEQQNALIVKRNSEISELQTETADLKLRLSISHQNFSQTFDQIERYKIIIEEQEKQINLLNALNNLTP